MKKIIILSILSVAFISMHGMTAAQTQSVPPNTKAGYYVKDGKEKEVFILRENKKEYTLRFVVPAQEGYPEMVVFTPEKVSEWGFLDETTRYISGRIGSGSDGEWYFMEEIIPVKLSDGSRIGFLSDKVLTVGTYFRVDKEGDAVETGTERNGAPLLDYFASETGYRSSDSHLKYPKRARKSVQDRWYDAFADRNDKLFPQMRFGVTVSGGATMVQFVKILTIIRDFWVPNPDTGFTVSAGAFLRIPIDGAFAFQPEVLYSYSTATGDMAYRSLDLGKTLFSMSSVRVPLLFRFTPARSASDWMPYFEAGPELDFNFGNYRHSTLAIDTSKGGIVAGRKERLICRT